MRLHEDWELFSDALQAASQPVEDGGLGIKSIFIEKDYWICRSLSLMAANDKDNLCITSCYIGGMVEQHLLGGFICCYLHSFIW